MKKIIKTKGLTCGVCSLKIEDKIKKLKIYESVKVDPILETITIESEQEINYAQLNKIIKSVERGASLVEEEIHSQPKPQKTWKFNIHLFLLIIGLIWLVINLVLFGYEEFGYQGLLLQSPLYLIIISWVGAFILLSYKIILNAIRGLINRDFFNENTLMLLASIGGLILGEYFEAIMVMVLFQLGEGLTDLVVVKSKKNVLDILDLRPKLATIIKNDEALVIEAKNIQIGDIVLVKVGDVIPCDGTIIEG
ncbi:MAG: heavy metal translocating P-type ATPase, partial [Acholeplasmatales bacterium]|nr:heavy metal translocating P-type ATPase [Acholeplasmatales bacterium]